MIWLVLFGLCMASRAKIFRLSLFFWEGYLPICFETTQMMKVQIMTAAGYNVDTDRRRTQDVDSAHIHDQNADTWAAESAL